jgi:hypothetical protein
MPKEWFARIVAGADDVDFTEPKSFRRAFCGSAQVLVMAKRIMVFVLVAGIDAALAAYLAWHGTGLASLGIVDFEVYHTAFAAVMDGKNPYDMSALQSYLNPALGYIPRGSYGFYYPPWILLFLSPVLELPIRTAALLWFAVNITLLMGSAVLVLDWAKDHSEPKFLLACASILLFPPAIEALLFGQVNILCMFGLAVVIWGISREKDWLAGIFVPIAMLKPQILFLPGMVLLYFACQRRRHRVAVWALVFMALSLMLTSFMSFDLAWNWLQNLPASARYLGSTAKVNNSLAGQAARISEALCGASVDWMRMVIPLASATLLAVLLVLHRRGLRLEDWLLPAIILSPFLSWYSWFHDNVVLLLPYAVILGRAWHSRAVPGVWRKTLAGAVILNLSTIVAMFVMNPETMIFWYPIALLCLHYRTVRLLPTIKADAS